MSDLLERARSDRNWLEAIVDRVPGFAGYQERETRREVDGIWRRHLAGRVSEVRSQLTGRIREMSRDGNLDAISGLDGSDKLLDGLANRIRTTDYGYSGFFDAVKVDVARLDEIYRFDLAFDDEVRALAEVVVAVGTPVGPDASQLRQTIEDSTRRWNSRRDLLDGIES